MAPNSHYCVFGRQSMMSVPSLVVISADDPNDIRVLCNGQKNANHQPDSMKKPPSVPAINVIPASPRSSLNRRKWANNDQHDNKIYTVDENDIHDWSMEDSEQVQTKVSSKSHSNTYVDNKNVTPFIIRRSPLKQVPSNKTEEIGPTQFGGVCKLNFNQISMSDDSEGSIITPTTPEVKQVFFPSPKYEKNETYESDDDADICDEVFGKVNLNSSINIAPDSKINYGSSGSEVDSNNNSGKQGDKFYNVTGEGWPPVELTPEQEQERFKIFCDNKFRESGGVTPVIVGTIPKSLPGGPTIRLPGVSAHYSYTGSMTLNRNGGTRQITPASVHPANPGTAAVKPQKFDFEGFCNSEQDKYEIDESGINQLCSKNVTQVSSRSGKVLSLKEKLHHKLVNQPRNISSFVTPPTQTWHDLVLNQNGPTPSPSQFW